MSEGLNLISSSFSLIKLGVTHTEEHFQEVMPDEVVLGIKLAVLLISIGLDSFQIEIRKFEELSIDQIQCLFLNKVTKDIDTDTEDVVHRI